MAGSGKTTFMQRVNLHGRQRQIKSYLVNLDPAVQYLPYSSSIDIRDTVNYKTVMKQFNLGPHGGILTALNLFATKFDKVLSLCERQCDTQVSFILADTPGQIEIFSWSAGGNIITNALACSFPTEIAFVVDAIRCQNPQTFVSNMLQACSILYKTRLPLLLIFNKCDISGYQYAIEWMSDFYKFQRAISEEE